MLINKNQKNELDILFKNNFLISYLIPAILFLIIGVVFKNNISLVSSCVLLFSVFDSIGYNKIVQEFGESVSLVVRYRILQIMFQLVLTALLVPYGLWVAASFNIFWWFGGCDYLYYVILRQTSYAKDETNFWWLWWTPIGLFLGIFNPKVENKKDLKYKISYNMFLYQAVLGFIISYLILSLPIILRY